jgi:2-isopropylmalate synthase
MALKTRVKFFNMETSIKSEQIYASSRLLTQLTGIPVQPNKAIVGANAFAHEAGIHQDGVLKNPLTYEIMTPESVGIKANNLVLGKHSGRHALADRVRDLGYELSTAEINRVFHEFKVLADKKKTVYDEDIEALVNQTANAQGRFQLRSLNVASGTDAAATATAVLDVDGSPVRDSGTGVGTVDAAMNTIKKITGSQCKLTQYKVTAISGGTDAQGEVTVAIEENGKTATGRGMDLDIVIASAKAFIVALNRIGLRKERVEGI